MSHLSQEEFVLSYYGEPGLGADRHEHLAQCQACIAELAGLAIVLDRVTPVDVPEPGDDYEARVWSRLPLPVTNRIGPLLSRKLP